MPSRAYTSFLPGSESMAEDLQIVCVNALSGLYLISTTIEDFSVIKK